MEYRTIGIIIRSYPLTETSLIVHWISQEFGLVTTLAKGARRPKSPFLGKLDLYYKDDFTFVRHRRSDLHSLREVSVLNARRELRRDVRGLYQAAYCAKLLERSSEIETPIPEYFKLFDSFLENLGAGKTQSAVIYAFEIKLLALAGVLPEFKASKVPPAVQTILTGLLEGNWAAAARAKLTPGQEKEANRFLEQALATGLEALLPERKEAFAQPAE